MKTLSDICEVYSGYALKEFNDQNDGLPVIKIGNIMTDGTLALEECQYTSEVVNEKYYSKKGDIYVALSGATTGKIGILESDERHVINQRVGVVRRKNNDVPQQFVKYFLMRQTDRILQEASGCAQPNISPKQIAQYEVPKLSKTEMEEISIILDKLSYVITQRKDELEKLDELIKARFVEMFDKCNEEVLIGDAISISRGASPRPIQSFITDDPEGVNWIKIGDVSENSLYITRAAEKITKEGAKKSRAVHKGDFILSNSMSFGRPYILDIEGCVHDGWLILSDFRDTFDELYLYHALRSERVQHQFSGKVNGATVKNLNSDLVKETYIKVPEMKEQETFADFVKQVDKSKVEVQKALDETQKLFDSLMQEYFG